MIKILAVTDIILFGLIIYLMVILIRVRKDEKRIKKEMSCRK